VAHYGDELRGCRDLRKHVAWYLKGYAVGHEVRAQLGLVDSLARLDELLGCLDGDQPHPGAPAEGPRGRAGTPRPVALPEGWLESRTLTGPAAASLHEAELATSGG